MSMQGMDMGPMDMDMTESGGSPGWVTAGTGSGGWVSRPRASPNQPLPSPENDSSKTATTTIRFDETP
jgi:hypothetical protein